MRTERVLFNRLLTSPGKPQSVNSVGSLDEQLPQATSHYNFGPVPAKPKDTTWPLNERRANVDRRQGRDRRNSQEGGLFSTRSNLERRKGGRRRSDYAETISIKV